jgi:predicted nucleic acid-binding protein
VIRRWFDGVPAGRLFLCAVAIGEFARSVAALPDGVKRRQTEHRLHHVLILRFPVLPFDLAASVRWGTLMGEGQRAGRTPPSDGAKIAAVAALHGLTVVTTNVADFAPLGVSVLDPTQP